MIEFLTAADISFSRNSKTQCCNIQAIATHKSISSENTQSTRLRTLMSKKMPINTISPGKARHPMMPPWLSRSIAHNPPQKFLKQANHSDSRWTQWIKLLQINNSIRVSVNLKLPSTDTPTQSTLYLIAATKREIDRRRFKRQSSRETWLSKQSWKSWVR